MGTVVLIALGVLCFVTGPALTLVIVLAVRKSARDVAASNPGLVRYGDRTPAVASGRHRR
ncbi:hypothetical protein [Nocardia sp. NBC_00511]|uniref:hypothetical protein n=1 Tax=Nocardia sp. NBC_00511 TaxID=2903591 RepID=UPI0030E2D184